MQRYEKNLAYAWILRDIFYFCCQNRQSMEQVLLFFLKVLTALAYVLALLSPFILIGWCFAEWRGSKARRKRWNETSKSSYEDIEL